MRLSNKVNWVLAALLILALFALAAPSWASGYDRDDDSDSDGDSGDIIGGDGGDGGAGGDGGHGGSGGEGGDGYGGDATGGDASVGDITVNNITEIPANTTHKARIENTPDIVTITPGSGDSCKAHIGFGVSIPGLGTSMNIPLPGKECRKLKAYDRAMAAEQWQAAEIMFCSFKEVKAEFRSFGLDCIDVLTLYAPPGPKPVGVTMTYAEYDDLLAQAASAEQIEEYTELVEYRYAQQQSLIEALEEGAVDDDNEIAALKKVVNDEVAEADARRAAVRAKTAAKKQKEESDGSENPDK